MILHTAPFRFAGPVALLVALAAPLAAQSTRPERTVYRETSTYADVVAFVDSLQRLGADLRVGVLGRSTEGREIPLVVAARPMVFSPGEAHRTGKPIVWLQGNIHAGEVEGKEVVQMMLRDLTRGPLRPLLDSVIILAVPIYNIDGNEAFAPGEENRPGQNGPARVGRGTNGQGFNLNRDYVKMEAPETRAAAAAINAWDPDFFVDLHTTNGSYHGYALTWSPGLNPNSTPANDWVRDRFLPEIRERMRTRHKQETFPYGNFRNQNPDSLVLGWETYDARPRFGTNWTGMRGRLAILSEAYSNNDFRSRISATYNFVREILSFAAEQRDTVKALVRAADARRPDSVVVRSVLAPPVEQPVIAEITESAGEGSHGFARRRRTGVYRTIRMPVYDRFTAARKEAMPSAYLIPPGEAAIAALLRRHGIAVGRLDGAWQGRAQAFAVDSVVAEPRPFEGHRIVRVEGAWGPARPVTVEAGWYVVKTDQRLGVLAAYILEPASEDGVVAWNFLDRVLRPGRDYPILRTSATVAAPTTEPAEELPR